MEINIRFEAHHREVSVNGAPLTVTPEQKRMLIAMHQAFLTSPVIPVRKLMESVLNRSLTTTEPIAEPMTLVHRTKRELTLAVNALLKLNPDNGLFNRTSEGYSLAEGVTLEFFADHH